MSGKVSSALNSQVYGSSIRPFEELVAAGYIGLAGTRMIAERKEAECKRWFSPAFLHTLDEADGFNVRDWQELGCAKTVTAYAYAGRGGILCALWELTGTFGCGADIDLRKFPLRQQTIEICERFGLNPYRLFCTNTALFAVTGASCLVHALNGAGIPAAVIGWIPEGKVRRVRSGDREGAFLERPAQDELEKI